MTDYAELRKLAENATPGPWAWEDEDYMGCGQVYVDFDAPDGVAGVSIAGPTGDCYPRSGYSPKEDMQFIAALNPKTVLALLNELESANNRLEQMAEFVDDLESFGPTFGPVNGTGRPDPKGQMMVDMPISSLVADLRRALSGKERPASSSPRRERCERCSRVKEDHAFGVFCP